MPTVARMWLSGELAGLRARASQHERMRLLSCIVATHNMRSASSWLPSGYVLRPRARSGTVRCVALTQA